MNSELFKRTISSVVLIALVTLIIIKGSTLFNLFLFVCFIIATIEWKKMSRNINYKYLGYVFLIFSFFSVYELYHLNNNYINFLFVLFICISTDIGGYVFGKIIKGPKLTKISPNKTYIGVFGGYILSLISVNILFKFQFLFSLKQELNFKIFFLIILISSISQFGDILISYFKRLSNLKNTGKIIPGHGGLLDRIDGMIFAFPVYYLLELLNLFKEF